MTKCNNSDGRVAEGRKLFADDKIEDLLSLNEALDRLKKMDARKSLILEYRYFGGLNNEEIAAAAGVSLATVKRDMLFSRAWLANELKDDLKPDLLQ